MSKNNIPLTDVECMVVIESLSMLIQDDEKHELDKRIAGRIRSLIFLTVKANKEQSISHKCEECKYLDLNKKHSVGYVCTNTNRVWRTNTAIYHQRTCKACKSFEAKETKE